MKPSNRVFISQNKTLSTPSYILYAGTSPGGLILKSVNNGASFTNEGTAGKGMPLAFCQLSNGDILYTTSTGWVVNYTKSINYDTEESTCYAITSLGLNIWVGNTAGNVRRSPDGGASWMNGSVLIGSKIHSLICIDLYNVLIFAESGIYNWVEDGCAPTLIQSGNFTCACDAGSGVLYAGTSNGHIWKSINSGASWTDLGKKITGNKIVKIVKNDDGIYYIDDYGLFYFTGNDFASYSSVGTGVDAVLTDLIYSNGSFILSGQGGESYDKAHVYISNNGGENWTDIGQQYSQTSINCLISVNN
jgi:hypothetical protein